MKMFRLTVASALFVIAAAACGRTPAGPSSIPGEETRLGDLTLSGRVFDAAAPGVGVGGVLVTAVNSGATRKATSESDGNFVIDGLNAGNWQVWFSMPGYVEQYLEVQLESSQSITGELSRDEALPQPEPLPLRVGKRPVK